MKQSRERLLEIVDDWSLARNIEAFFEDAAKRSAVLGADRKATIEERLAKARTLLGGLDALERFASWRTPAETLNMPDDAADDEEIDD